MKSLFFLIRIYIQSFFFLASDFRQTTKGALLSATMSPFRMAGEFMEISLFEGSSQRGQGAFVSVYFAKLQGQVVVLEVAKLEALIKFVRERVSSGAAEGCGRLFRAWLDTPPTRPRCL